MLVVTTTEMHKLFHFLISFFQHFFLSTAIPIFSSLSVFVDEKREPRIIEMKGSNSKKVLQMTKVGKTWTHY